MRWTISHRADDIARPLADRHYNRQKIGAKGFVPPGRCLVLTAGSPPRALWVTSWPFAEYVRHAWAGAWVCSCFRNEGAGLSSELIYEAEQATRAYWGDPPPLGFITFVDAKKTEKKDKPGWCYRKAGWKHAGFTKGGLWALSHAPEAIPDARPAHAKGTLGASLANLEVSLERLARAL